tara:strand:+ start:7414 stop:8184 length:771 start_codon:yes stop_codon:yes gene_type:complete
MQTNYILSTKDLKFYRKYGYLVIKNFFLKKDIPKIINWVGDIEKFKNVKGKWMKYYDPSIKNKKKQILTRVENFYDYHKKFKNFFSKKIILDQFAKLAGGKVCLFKDKINFKYPGSKGFEPHQDATIWKNMYGIRNFLTIVVSVDKSDIKNGCLEIAEGNNIKRLLGKEWKKIPKKIEKKLKWRKIETKPGDIIIFHDYTPHKSANNFSYKKRRMIFLTYNKLIYGDHRIKHFKDKRKNFPPNFEREKGKKYTFHI